MTRAAPLARLALALTLFLIGSVIISAPLTAAPLARPANSVTHIVISEIQISGDGADPTHDQFVELYNPTDAAIVMSSWRLARKNANGVQATLVAFLDGTIPAHGYFLIGHGTAYNGDVPLDVAYSAPSNALANNYSVLLYRDDDVTIEDRVAIGAGTDPEGNPFPSNPTANNSIERKANTDSTSDTMSTGGADEFSGNGEDSDDNSADFVLRTNPQPQNSSSPTEIPPTVPSTPTLTPIPTDSPTDPATNTSTATATLTNTPVDTATLTPTPTDTIPDTATFTPPPPAHLVISQIYSAGGNNGATYDHDYIEIFNPGSDSVNLNGWSVQYAAASGTNWNVTALPDINLAPGQYFLVQERNGGSNGVPLPAPDASDSIALSATAGKVALLNTIVALSGSCPADGSIADFVGYGANANCFQGSSFAPAPDTANAIFRATNGCQDTRDNATDFVTSPANPRNTGSTFTDCFATATPTVIPTDTATPPATQTPTITNTPALAPHIVISEFRTTGPNGASDEFIELFNPSNLPVDLTGWKIYRSNGAGVTTLHHTISSVVLQPGQHFLMTRSGASTYSGNVVGDELLNVGVTNDGGLALVMPDNTLVDAVGLSATSAYQEGTPLEPMSGSAEQSYERAVGGEAGNCLDSNDNASDFVFNTGTSNPQNLASPFTYCTGVETATPTDTVIAVPTGTPTTTPTPIPSATPTPTRTNTPPAPALPLDVVINEVAWAGTQAGSADEWIELFNNKNAPTDLTGWTLQAADGSPNILLAGTIGAHDYFLLERTDDTTVSDIPADQVYTGALNNDGETLILRDAASNVIDTANSTGEAWVAGSLSPPCSMERINSLDIDRPSNWATNDDLIENGLDADANPICGTPNQENSPAQIEPTRTPTNTVTATNTATPTATGTPAPDGLYVNEFLPNPLSDWNNDGTADDGDTWIEIYNANPFAVNLAGWQLDDVANGGSNPYTLPQDTLIAPKGFRVFFGSDSHLNLNNSNDDVRLLRPDATIADAISYKTSDPDVSWSRNPDGAAYFTTYCLPTPNGSNCTELPAPTFTPTPYSPRILINEFLPAPYKDWNNDGKLDSDDEWIELYNESGKPVDVSGWQLDDAKHGSAPFHIPGGTLLAPHSFRVYFGSETHIGLNNDGDTVRLLHPDATVADKKQYTPLETNASAARSPDGSDNWVITCVPTPGITNCSQEPTPTPTRSFALTNISDARQLPDGALVSILGSVVAHPCELDTHGHELVLSDGIAGMDAYFNYPNRFDCKTPRSTQLVLTGILGDHYGLKTLYPRDTQDIYVMPEPLREIPPREIHTGDLGEATEAMLVTVQGTVSNGKGGGDILWVNDGTGIAELHANGITGASFAGITHGSIVRVTGISYQHNTAFLVPRAPDDIEVLRLADKTYSAARKRQAQDLGQVSIAQAMSAPLSSYVTVSGIITVPPGPLGKRDFWMQDDSGMGAHIYLSPSTGKMPPLEMSDQLAVHGRIASFSGTREIRVEQVDAITNFGTGARVTPLVWKTGKIDFTHEGALIQIQGYVASNQGREIRIDDGSGEVLVYLNAKTHIHWGTLHVGEPARITGILTRFHGEPEILPRFQNDVFFGAPPHAPTAQVEQTAVPLVEVHGESGDDLAVLRILTARALVFLTSQAPANPPPPADLPAQNSPAPAPLDAVALVCLLLVTGAALCGRIAYRKYRGTKNRGSSA